MEKPGKSAAVGDIVLVGVFSALVFAASWVQIPIPTALGTTRIHLGNIFCLLSGFMLGALKGGLSAGIGSMLFDLTNPLYIASSPFTLVFKFVMGFLCGLIGFKTRGKNPVYKVAAATAGQLAYIILYLSKTYIEAVYWSLVDKSAAWAAVAVRIPVSLTNGAIAVVISVPMAITLQRALKDIPLYRKFIHK